MYKRWISVVLLFLAANLGLSQAQAQPQWPDKPIRLIVPWPAGGVADFLARHLSQRIAQDLGQAVIVENKAGAGTNIGSEFVARAAPDGYTLLLASSNNAVNMSLFRKMPYDAVRDFTPISLLAYVPNVLVVNPDVPAHTVHELVAYAKKHPGELTYASAGNGSPAHLAAEQFNRMAKVDIRGIPFKGAAPAVADLMAGHVNIMFTNLAAAQGAIQGGKLRALGMAGKTRSSLLPDLPTIAEAGVPGYEATAWYGLMAPAGTPAPVIDRLQKALGVVRSDASLQAMRQRGTEPVVSAPDELRKRLQADIGDYAALIKASGITNE